MNTRARFLTLLFLLAPALFNCSSGQKSLQVPMDESHWNIQSDNYKIEEHLGEQSLFLPSGTAQLNDVLFHNGIIEFDIAFPEGRGFPGVHFRMQDGTNYEEVYVRPHQSGNPDANQYTPVFNGMAGWQLYHGEGHGAPVAYKYNEWNHIKLVISGTTGEVFINDIDEAVFQIVQLKHGDVAGPIRLNGSANAHFANFTYSPEDRPELSLPLKELARPDANVISSYQVSQAIEPKMLNGKHWFGADDLKKFDWKRMKAEYTGTLNMARVAVKSKDKNLALAKFTISAQKDMMKKLDFGYSDLVTIYVNGKAIYSGNNTYRTRDYRYLGTIGWFDAIYLDLKAGDNEIVFAVTENFGGWGMRAQLENLEGITIKNPDL